MPASGLSSALTSTFPQQQRPATGRAGELDPGLAHILDRELRGGVRYFWETSNSDPASPGYGLALDRWGRGEPVASVAAVGFGLSALAIGAARGWIPRERALERVMGTLRSLQRIERWHGFWTHFVNINTAARHKAAEFSTIDTALALCGALSAAAYFQDSQLSALVEELLGEVEWARLVFQRDGRTLLHMAYNADRGGDYACDADASGLISAWDMTAEQLCMYLLAAGHPDVPADLARDLYDGFDRPLGRWGGAPFVYTPGGAMFIYQFTHCWFPFQSWRDQQGFDWFGNSREAIIANRNWCIDHADVWRTLGPYLWGLTAGDGPTHYIVSGTPVDVSPRPWPYCEGTVQTYSLTASLPFVPDLAGESLVWLDRQYPQIWGRYGLHDAINLEAGQPRIVKTVLGIDKGPSVLMIDNYLHGTTWESFGEHPWIRRALQKLGWVGV